MATPIGTYSFLSHLRIGLANQITEPNQDPIKLRSTFDLTLHLEGKPVAGGAPLVETIQKPIQLYGPGDIVGIESRAIFKTEPLNWVTNFESNYLPYIDFYEEDFPWRYTPSRSDDGTPRLRPWIALVVLEEDEFKDGTAVRDNPLPFIQTDKTATTFPLPDQLWAWAHVHVNRDLGATNEEIQSTNMNAVLPRLDGTLRESADLAYSRLLCPRRLKSNTAYHAFLIPTFETGRRAGLGMTVESDFATQYAWGQKPDQTAFPYYHRWFFRTGSLGDFEYLVRLLKPKTADDRVGRRDMDLQEPGWNITGLDPDDTLGGILRLGGALRVPKEAIRDPEAFKKYEFWAVSGYPQPIQRSIANFINLADEYQKPGPNPQPIPDPDNALDPDPLITPPLYGRWHAAVDRLLTDHAGVAVANDRNWVHELNLDPRFRVPAGFGTRVVQKNQEDYMNVAWQQIGDVLDANRIIRYAQLAHAALFQWHARQLTPLLAAQPESLLLLAAPVQKRVLYQNATVAHQLKMSLVPPVAMSAQMRRILRPRGRAVTRLALVEPRVASTMVSGLNAGTLVPAPPKALPAGILTETSLADATQPPLQPAWLVDLLKRYPRLPQSTLALALLIVAILLLIGASGVVWLIGLAVAGGLVYASTVMNRLLAQMAKPPVFKDGAQTPAIVDQAPASPDFHVSKPDDGFRPTPGAVDSIEAQRFKVALKDMYAVDVAAAAAAARPPKRALDLRAVAQDMLATLHPDRSLPRLVLDRILLPERFRDRFVPEQFDEIMNYPRFDVPMYKPLADLSKEYFLPNINLIEPNSITLLRPNEKFIESYMVGLNHELARELLWREYPTDQRGSYFRQFWDVSGYLPETGEDVSDLKEKLKDIPEIHTWPRASRLGYHDNRHPGRVPPADEGVEDEDPEVVLVIRGELLKKYPTAVVYAHKAKWQKKMDAGGHETSEIDNTKERDLADIPAGLEDKPPRTIVKTPLYSAKIEPDIYFFGFDLKSAEAKGEDGSHPGDEDHPGWFFVIKERPGEPRFGLDIGGPSAVRHTWSDLAWEDVTPAVAEGAFLQIAATTAPIALTKPTDTSQAEFDEELEQHGEDQQILWRKEADAADLAYVLYQVPVMVAVHGHEMLTIK
jgi:hypothetical protein